MYTCVYVCIYVYMYIYIYIYITRHPVTQKADLAKLKELKNTTNECIHKMTI